VSETACLLTFRAVLKRNLAIKFTPAPDGRPNQQDGLPFVFSGASALKFTSAGEYVRPANQRYTSSWTPCN